MTRVRARDAQLLAVVLGLVVGLAVVIALSFFSGQGALPRPPTALSAALQQPL